MFIVGSLNELFRHNVDMVGVKVTWYQTFIAFKTNHVLVSRSFGSAKKPLYVCTSASVHIAHSKMESWMYLLSTVKPVTEGPLGSYTDCR